MKKKELIERLKLHEWDDFEVKEAKRQVPREVWKTVSAFANTEGGYVVLGIVDKGRGNFEISGVNDVEKMQSDFLTVLRGEKFNIQLSSKGHIIDFEGKKVLVFKINSMTRVCKPVYYGGDIRNSYIRQGSGDQRCSREEINRMLREASEFSSDSMILEGYKIDDIDFDTVSAYRNYLKLQSPENPFLLLDEDKFLKKIGCIAPGKDGSDELTMAGLLLFGKKDSILNRFPAHEFDIYLVPRDDIVAEGTIWMDRKIYEENLILTYLSAINYLKSKIEIPFAFAPDGITRTEEVPLVIAIREALVNMLIHRDYFDNTQARIKLFHNKLEMFNPGSSPKSIQEIIENSITAPRNPVIAKVFRLAGWSEVAGSGMMKIFNNLQKIGYPEPCVENNVSGYFFKITLYLEEENIYIRNVRENAVHTTENAPEIAPVKLTDLQTQILEQIKKNNKVTYQQIADKLEKNIITIKRNAGKLKYLGIIERRGSSKNGHWVFLNNDVLDTRLTAEINIADSLTEVQNRIFQEINKNRKITYVELAKKIGKDKSTIHRNIRKLKEIGVLARKGSGKRALWEI